MATATKKPKAAFVLDADMPSWLEAEAKRQSTSMSTIVRQAIRALMTRLQQQQRGAA